MRMIETGVLAKVQKLILPDMPYCTELTVFNSAKISDVFTAFGLVMFGIGCGVLVGVAEVLWKRRGRSMERGRKLK